MWTPSSPEGELSFPKFTYFEYLTEVFVDGELQASEVSKLTREVLPAPVSKFKESAVHPYGGVWYTGATVGNTKFTYDNYIFSMNVSSPGQPEEWRYFTADGVIPGEPVDSSITRTPAGESGVYKNATYETITEVPYFLPFTETAAINTIVDEAAEYNRFVDSMDANAAAQALSEERLRLSGVYENLEYQRLHGRCTPEYIEQWVAYEADLVAFRAAAEAWNATVPAP